MAFKILNSNQIELLTESQRESYEKELAIYNERVKFVEQIEQFENTVITPYEPKLTNISAISKAPEKEFGTPEYVIAKIEPVTKPELKVVSVSFDEPVTVALPKHMKIKNVPVEHVKKVEQCKPALPNNNNVVIPRYSKIENVSLEHVKKVEQCKPDLPKVFMSVDSVNLLTKAELQSPLLKVSVKTSIPSKSFKELEQVRPNLPTAVKLHSFVGLVFEPVDIENVAIKENSPKMTTPTMQIPAFIVPENSAPLLPKTEVNFPEVKVLDVSEQIDPVLPKAIIPKQVKVSFKQENKTKAILPDVSNISTVSASFGKPNIQNTELPITQKVGIPTKEFVKTEHTLSYLPTLDTPKASVQAYIVPQFGRSTIPTVTKPDVKSRTNFNPLFDNTPKIKYPSISVIPVNTFQKVSNKVSGLPSVSVVAIPDAYAYEALKNLLPAKNKTEIREGALV